MTFHSTLNWTKFLDSAIQSLNDTPMKCLDFYTPNEVASNKEVEAHLKRKFYDERIVYKRRFSKQKPVFTIGQKVLKVKKPSPFVKGYRDNTENDVFEVNTLSFRSTGSSV